MAEPPPVVDDRRNNIPPHVPRQVCTAILFWSGPRQRRLSVARAPPATHLGRCPLDGGGRPHLRPSTERFYRLLARPPVVAARCRTALAPLRIGSAARSWSG